MGPRFWTGRASGPSAVPPAARTEACADPSRGGTPDAPLPPPAVASPPPVARGYAPVNGLRIYYEVHGPAGGTPLVLLHGGDPAIETSWARLLPVLARVARGEVEAFLDDGG
jgi:hypothetical protein